MAPRHHQRHNRTNAAYSEQTSQPIVAGGSFIHGTGFDILPLLSEHAGVWVDLALSHFDSASQLWRFRLQAIPVADPSFPEFLRPGQPIYVKSDAPAVLEIPDPPSASATTTKTNWAPLL